MKVTHIPTNIMNGVFLFMVEFYRRGLDENIFKKSKKKNQVIKKKILLNLMIMLKLLKKKKKKEKNGKIIEKTKIGRIGLICKEFDDLLLKPTDPELLNEDYKTLENIVKAIDELVCPPLFFLLFLSYF
jgi:hypothetical protein